MAIKVENKNYKEKEFNLVQSEDSDIFEFIKDTVLDGVWHLDIEDINNQWFSPKIWSILGYRSVEVKYGIDDWNAIIHPEDLQLLISKFQKNLKKPRTTLNQTIRFFHKDGSIVWFNCFCKVLSTESENTNKLFIALKNNTDLKLAENKFLKIEDTFFEMNKVAKIGHWEVDIIKNELFWSDYCKVIHDVTNDYAPDIFNAIFFYEEGESRDRMMRILEACSKFGTSWDEEFKFVTESGSKWVRVIGNAVFEDGECKKIFGVIQDISKQKEQKFALTISQNQFKQIFDHAKVGMCMLDFEDNFLEVNKSMCKFLGYTRKEFLSIKGSSITHPISAMFTENKMEELISGVIDSYQTEKKYFHKNGQSVSVIISASLVRNSKNEPQFIIKEVQDITEVKLSEDALLKSVNEVTLTAKHYKSLLDNKSVYINKVDLNGNYTYFNNHYCSHFGFDQSTIGTSALQGIIEEDHSLFTDILSKCILEPEVSHQVVLRKIKFDKAIGGSKWEFKGILDDEGNMKEILCVGIDVTKEVRSLERAKHLLALTEKQNVQLKSFNYIVSHDIRSHAANIKGLIELIPSITEDDERETVFEMLNVSSKKLSETLDNLNQIISISDNKFEHYSEVKLLQEVNKTLKIFSYQIKETDVTFSLNIDENLTLRLVKAYLDSILLNILSNAIKFHSKKRNLVVTISAYKTHNGIEVKISDNGRGFDYEKFKSKVFGMYKTFHAGEDSRGFGLYITKSQTEAMGGTISVESQIEIGTTFTLNFPC